MTPATMPPTIAPTLTFLDDGDDDPTADEPESWEEGTTIDLLPTLHDRDISQVRCCCG